MNKLTNVLNLLSVLCLMMFTPYNLANDNSMSLTETSLKHVEENVISLNHATIEQLASLKGVGQAKAEAIIAHRNRHGDFATVEGILQVKGIGDKILTVNRSRLTL